MFFTRLAKIVAWLAFVFGGLRFAMALGIAFVDDPATRAWLTSEYLGSGPTGRHIDRALYVMLFGIILGAVLEHFTRTAAKAPKDS